MKRIRHHYAIVGSRPGDLILPLLDPHFEKGVLRLLTPQRFQLSGEQLAASVRDLGFSAEVSALPALHDREVFETVLRDIARQHDPATAGLNVSGVDPLYALPAANAFHGAGHPVYAVDPDSDWLVWLRNGHGSYSSFNIVDRLNLPQFVAVHGLIWRHAFQTWRRPMVLLNQSAIGMARSASTGAVADLNKLARSKKWSEPVAVPDGNVELTALVDLLIGANLALRTSSRALSFVDEAAQRFACGGWLECRLFYAVMPLLRDGLVQDLASGVRVATQEGWASEWDVAFLANNNLYIIECKTEKPVKADNRGIGNEAMFKLRSILEMRGLGARGMLATTAQATAGEKKLARQIGIRIETIGQGPNLTDRIRDWIAGTADSLV